MNDDNTVEASLADPTIGLVTDIVSAYLSHNRVPVGELPTLIASTYVALSGLSQPVASAGPESERATPAQIRKSITHEALVSFIDGKGYKTLKRHLTRHGLDIHGYRARFGLPSDYPSTAASYSAQRSQLARSLGLGQLRKAEKAAGAPEVSTKPGRGRKPKAAAAE